jgi:hypothetical protein
MFGAGADSIAGFNVVDRNNIDRLSAYLSANVMALETRDSGGNVTGSVP